MSSDSSPTKPPFETAALESLHQTIPASPLVSVQYDSSSGAMQLAEGALASVSDALATAQPRWGPSAVGPEASDGQRYVLKRVAGRGGFGEVWEAIQVALGRAVAVKRLRPDRLDPDDPQRAEANARSFRQEALTAARLEHPGIVPVYDLGADENGSPLIAMKFARGREWGQIAAEDRVSMSVEDFLAKHLSILVDAAQAVSFAHSQGIVHRDLKPSQVVVGDFGEVLLMDWGLAVLYDEGPLSRDGTEKTLREIPTPATASSPAGTPALMAPEQVRFDAGGIGPWTDVYLLGGTLYFLLTGTYPHEAQNGLASMKRALVGLVEAPEKRAPNCAIPAELSDLCMKALARDPADRIGSAKLFIARVEAYLGGTTRRRESESLTTEIAKAIGTIGDDYATHNALAAQLGKARDLWPQNPAVQVLSESLHASYARAALAHADLRLAAVQAELLPPGDSRTRIESDIGDAEELARRNASQRRSALVGAFALLVAIVAGSIFFSVRLSEEKDIAQKERKDADAARGRAERAESDSRARRKQAEGLFAFAMGDLRTRLKEVNRLDLLDQTADKAFDYYREQDPVALPAEDRVKFLAAVYELGELYRAQGNTARALDALELHARFAAQLAASEPASLDWKWAIANGTLRRGLTLCSAGRYEEGKPLVERSLGELEAARAKDPRAYAMSMAEAYGELAGIASRDSDTTTALAFAARSKDVLGEFYAPDGADAEILEAMASARYGVAEANQSGGALEEALSENALAIADIQRAVELGKRGGAAGTTRNVPAFLYQRVRLLREMRRFKEAMPVADEMVAGYRRILERDKTSIPALTQLYGAVALRGGIADAVGNYEVARADFEETMSTAEAMMRRDPANHFARRDYLSSLNNYATLLINHKEYAEARKMLVRFIEEAQPALTDTSLGSDLRYQTMFAEWGLGRVCNALAEYDQALVHFDKAIADMTEMEGPDRKFEKAFSTIILAHSGKAETLFRLGDIDALRAMLPTYRSWIETARAGRTPPATVRRHEAVYLVWEGYCHDVAGDMPAARACWERVIELVKADCEKGTSNSCNPLLSAYVLLGRREDALPLYQMLTESGDISRVLPAYAEHRGMVLEDSKQE